MILNTNAVKTAQAASEIKKLYASQLETLLGPMLAIADKQALYLLEFTQRVNLDHELARLQIQTKSEIITGETTPLNLIKQELEKYFAGNLSAFTTPIKLRGTDFQQLVWQELQKIPHGQTRSYAQIAKNINMPTAYRAVALANSQNELAIIIPCHRVINSTGTLGGYAAGVERKQWLLEHEKKSKS